MEIHVVKKYINPDDLVFNTHEYFVDLQANEIYLVSNYHKDHVLEDVYEETGVEHSQASHFLMNLNMCKKASPGKPLTVHMKSCGGSWEEGMAIYDAIFTYPELVTCINWTGARSMTSIIFQAADRRVMMPNSYFMFHEGTMGFDGTQRQFRTEFEWNKRTERVMLDIYAGRMAEKGRFEGQAQGKIRKFLKDQMMRKEEVYLTPQETIELGLADEIAE
jgi:ATP-dependent protease ClpP protease subunit